MNSITIKRIYDEPTENDGYRILVDRLWPRGITKARASLNEWNKEIAPSHELRKWFNHDAERFEEFSVRYQQELLLKVDELNRIRKLADSEPVTLLYAAKDPKLNQAVVLRNVLLKNY